MRRLQHACFPFLSTAILCLLPLVAHAEPIRVTSGSATVYMPVEPSGASLSNDAGFFLAGDGFGSLFWAGGAPGETRTLDGTFTFGLTGPFTAQIDGASYTAYLSGSLNFLTDPFVLPEPAENGGGPFATAFSMNGRVRGYSTALRQPDSLLFDVELFGTGTANGTAGYNSSLSGYLPLSAAAAYRFAPADLAATPEPGSLVLLGTGAIGLILRRRRQQPPA